MLALIAAIGILGAAPPSREDCLRQAGEVPLDMTACYAAERERWERRMNAAVARIGKVGSSSDGAALARAQTEWRRRRDRTCDAAGMMNRGGSQEGADVAACMTRETQLHALELERERQR